MSPRGRLWNESRDRHLCLAATFYISCGCRFANTRARISRRYLVETYVSRDAISRGYLVGDIISRGPQNQKFISREGSSLVGNSSPRDVIVLPTRYPPRGAISRPHLDLLMQCVMYYVLLVRTCTTLNHSVVLE